MHRGRCTYRLRPCFIGVLSCTGGHIYTESRCGPQAKGATAALLQGEGVVCSARKWTTPSDQLSLVGPSIGKRSESQHGRVGRCCCWLELSVCQYQSVGRSHETLSAEADFLSPQVPPPLRDEPPPEVTRLPQDARQAEATFRAPYGEPAQLCKGMLAVEGCHLPSSAVLHYGFAEVGHGQRLATRRSIRRSRTREETIVRTLRWSFSSALRGLV